MSTQALIRHLMNNDTPTASAVDALHRLLDDATAEVAVPVGIAVAATLTGLTTATLRYYETEGLVRPGRDQSGYRSYGAAELRRLVFLTRMRLSGMRMRELKRYIRLVEEGDETAPERRTMMTQQRSRESSPLPTLSAPLEPTRCSRS